MAPIIRFLPLRLDYNVMENDPLADIFGDTEQPTSDPVAIAPASDDPLSDIFEDSPAQTRQPISDPLADIFENQTPLARDPLSDIFDDAETLEMEVVDDDDRVKGFSDAGFWGGLVAQVGISEGGRIAATAGGAALGTAIAPGPGTAIGAVAGYVLGGLLSGAAGSYTAQRMENQPEISYGRMITDTMINLFPASAFVKGGTRGLARIQSAAYRQGVFGTAVGATGAVLEGIVDEGKMPELRDIRDRMVMGALLGSALGATTQSASRLYQRMTKMTPEQLQRAALGGDPEIVKLTNFLTDMADLPPPTVREQLNMLGNSLFTTFMPGKRLGSKIVEEIRSAENYVRTGELIGRDANTAINRALRGVHPNERQSVMDGLADYLSGNASTFPSALKSARSQLNQYRQFYTRMIDKVMEADAAGIIRLPDHLRTALPEQASRGRGWLTRAHRFWTDKTWNPTRDMEARTIRELAQGFRRESVNKGEPISWVESLRQARNKVGEWREIRNSRLSEQGKMIGRTRSGILEEQKNLGPATREFLGEIRDVGARIEASAVSLSRLAAWDAADANIVRFLQESGRARSTRAGEGANALTKLSLRRGPLDDVFVDPEINRALQQMYGAGVMSVSGNWAARFINDTYNTLVSASKFALVPLGLVQYVTNPITNLGQVVQQGFMPLPNRSMARSVGMASKTFDAIRDNFTGPRGRAYYNRLSELGIIEPGVLVSDILAGLKQGSIGKWFARQPVTQIAGKAYSASDVALRVFVFEGYVNNISRHAPKMQSKLGRRAVQDLAAEYTRNTYQYYPYINQGVRTLSRYGVLNQFVAFTAELLRNQYHQGRLIYDMSTGAYQTRLANMMGFQRLAGESTRDFYQRAGINNKAVNRNLALRVASVTAMYGAATYGIYEFNRRSGIEGAEYDAAMDVIAPPWLKGQNVLFRRKENGEFDYKDMSYILPQAQTSAPAMAAWRIASNGGSWSDVVEAGWSSFYRQVGGELSFVMQRLVPAFANYNPANGGKLSTREGDLENAVERAGWFAREFEPGFWRELRSTFGEEATRTPEQFGRRMMGFRINTTTLDDSAQGKAREVARDLNTLRARWNTAERQNLLGREGGAIERDFQEVFGRVHQHVASLRTLGMSDSDIAKNFMEGNFGGNNTVHALHGTFPSIVRDRSHTISGQWDAILEMEPQQRLPAIRNAETREMREALMRRYKRLKEDEALGIGPIERIVRGQAIQDGGRADMIWRMMQQSDNPDQVLANFRRRIGGRQPIATDDVVRQIRLKQRAN